MKKNYQDMTTAELAQATRRYDRPGTINRTRPLNAAERAQERKARRVGRPKVGRGSVRINITLERGLLERANDAALRRNIARSELIAQGLQSILAHKTRKAG